jgi:hypothetical protein
MDWWRKRKKIKKQKIVKVVWKTPYVNFSNLCSSGCCVKENSGPSYTFDDGRSFKKALEKKGWETLGSGHYSYVLGRKNSEKAIKIGSIIERDGWIDYVHWANKNGYGGTFAPKVYSFKHIKGKKKDFTLTLMEKIEKNAYSIGRKHDTRPLPELVQQYVVYENEMAGKLIDYAVPGLKTFTDELRKEFPDHFDLHNGNFMVRSNDSFVITDPISGFTGTSKFRLRSTDFTPISQSIH